MCALSDVHHSHAKSPGGARSSDSVWEGCTFDDKSVDSTWEWRMWVSPLPRRMLIVLPELHHSYAECLLCLSDLRHSHANRQGVKGCGEGVARVWRGCDEGVKSPNGVPPSDSPRLFNLRNLVQTSRVDG